ncbi:hypothetical protein PV773_22825 [Mesorhizobium sp. CC13]|uniref:hypothetical protein n=1 Tax=Mesorhizobium sp. CC13 TaxID=3029194 RepID=UPI003267E5D1
MREIPWTATLLTLALFALPGTALAEETYNFNQNQTGFTLPGVTLPQGQDEVRAADGTTCRSAVSGSGAYLDVGVIQGNNRSNNDLATYGRVVIPIGRTPKRLDCSKLYELEVARLQLELKLLKMGLSGQGETTGAIAAKSGWADTGWTDGSKQK